MGPDSFQWCPVTEQGATGTNWSTRSSIWTRGWRSPGPGCPGRLCSVLLWRYSNPAWTWSCAACSGWPCLGRGLDWMTHRGPFQPLPYFDSVILWSNGLWHLCKASRRRLVLYPLLLHPGAIPQWFRAEAWAALELQVVMAVGLGSTKQTKRNSRESKLLFVVDASSGSNFVAEE